MSKRSGTDVPPRSTGGRSESDLRLLLRLLTLLRPYRVQFFSIFGLSLLATPLALLAPVPLAVTVDSVLGSKPLPGFIDAIVPASVGRSSGALLGLAIGLLIAIALLLQLQSMGRSLLTTYTGERLQLDLRSRLFDHAQRLSLTYHDSVGTADSTYRIQNDASAVEAVTIGALPGLATSLLTVGMMMYVTFRLDWALGLVTLAVSPFLFALSHLYRRRYRGRYREVKQLESSALAVIQEVLTGVRVVKAFGQEEREHERFVRRSREGMAARLRLAVAEEGLGALTSLFIAGGTAAVLYIGVRHVQAGSLTLGNLLLVMTYVAQLYTPLKTLSKKITILQRSLASAERAFELLDRPPDVQETSNPRPLVRARGDIELRNVSFAYDGQPVLLDVSLSIPSGARLGIAGKTGAGKSTLASLLPRFYEATSGRILLDGVDLRDYALKDLREQFAIVLQDTILFSATVAENIGYGRPHAHFEDIVAAAKAAKAHDFIEALPEGYDTLVGERGMKLSGGERQRIALARAFLKDAPILILDEPTSSVDIKTEAEIMEAIDRLMVGRTTLMIAHRRSTLDICDVRLEMDDGRVMNQEARVSTSSIGGSSPARLNGSRTRTNGNGAARPNGARTNGAVAVAAAWAAVHPEGPAPSRIELIKERRGGNRVAVFRLHGLTPDDAAVVAKRAPRRISLVERVIHEQLLPLAGFPGFAFHGFFEEPDGTDCWLFTADLDGAPYLPRRASHQKIAGRWLGQLHTTTADLGGRIALPDRGGDYFAEQLHQVLLELGTGLDSSASRPADRATIAELIEALRDAERFRPEISRISEMVPSVLVHGDFGRKNLRLGRGPGGPHLVAFDWEMSGWGPPMVDLARTPIASQNLGAAPDLRAYQAVVVRRWPELTPRVIGHLAHLGSVFRCVLSISWTAAHLDHMWEDCMEQFSFYTKVLCKLSLEYDWKAARNGTPR